MLAGKRILLIIGGGIAAYKTLDLIRRLRERGVSVTPVMTSAAEQFVTPLSVAATSMSPRLVAITAQWIVTPAPPATQADGFIPSRRSFAA